MDSLKLVLGIYDDPEKQTQDNYWIDLYQSNLAILGSAMSGKTTLLKTIINRIHQVVRYDEAHEEIYILDFSNSLKLYSELPYVVAYFDASNDENVRRMFNIIEGKLSDNTKDLGGTNYYQSKEKTKIPHISFIIDGLSSFMQDTRYTTYQESLLKIARDGVSKGVTVIFTATETNGIGRLLSYFNRTIGFDLSKEKYSELFSGRVDKPIINKGRGLANIDTSVYEFQAFLPYNADMYEEYSGEESAIEEFKTSLKIKRGIDSECTVFKSKKLKSFDGDLTEDNWSNYTSDILKKGEYCYPEKSKSKTFEVSVGIDYYTFKPININLLSAETIAIYGKKTYGKSNLLYALIEALLKIPDVKFLLWDDGREGLNDISELIEQMRCKKIVDSRETFEENLKYFGFGELPESMNIRRDPSEKKGSKPHLCDAISTMLDGMEGSGKIITTASVNENVECSEDDIRAMDISNGFTVVIIQSNKLYLKQPGKDSEQLISRMTEIIGKENTLFIYSDTKQIVSSEVRAYFNERIKHAFLLDDIVRFIDDKGKNSVFADQDRDELKESFGKCELGDGFYFDRERDKLTKLKFVKKIDRKES